MKYAAMVLAMVCVFALPTAAIADPTGKERLDGNLMWKWCNSPEYAGFCAGYVRGWRSGHQASILAAGVGRLFSQELEKAVENEKAIIHASPTKVCLFDTVKK